MGPRTGCLAALACTALLGCSSSAPGAAPASAPAPQSPSPPSPSPSPSAAEQDGGITYVALGDSVAAGVGAGTAAEGYVPVLAGLLSDRIPVSVRNLAVPGATTGRLLQQQLPSALGELAGDSDVHLVTVTIGGNDVFVPVVQACARSAQDPACPQAVRASVEQVDAGVDVLLRRLGQAAGPRTTVAVMAYYDPLPACRLAPLSPLAQQVLEGSAEQQGLNDVLRARAAQHGAVVVETADRLTPPDDFVGGLDCLHPSTSGHARIARAFAEAVEGRLDGE